MQRLGGAVCLWAAGADQSMTRTELSDRVTKDAGANLPPLSRHELRGWSLAEMEPAVESAFRVALAAAAMQPGDYSVSATGSIRPARGRMSITRARTNRPDATTAWRRYRSRSRQAPIVSGASGRDSIAVTIRQGSPALSAAVERPRVRNLRVCLDTTLDPTVREWKARSSLERNERDVLRGGGSLSATIAFARGRSCRLVGRRVPAPQTQPLEV